jgi:hypothetical protein
MNIDLDNIQKAMDWLAETPGGDQALKALSDAGEALRAAIPTELNDAELRYILERLMAQRNLGNWTEKLEPAEVAGYDLQPVGGLFPTATGMTKADLSPQLMQTARVLNYGFIIKASIPEPSLGSAASLRR